MFTGNYSQPRFPFATLTVGPVAGTYRRASCHHTEAAAKRAAKKNGGMVVKMGKSGWEPLKALPHRNDAQAWDDLRMREGHPSR